MPRRRALGRHRRGDAARWTESDQRTYTSRPCSERQNYASRAHGAQFIEVKVGPDLRTIRVTRAIEVSAGGKIINPKASHRQEIGGTVWGIGIPAGAQRSDRRYGRIMKQNLQH